MKMFKFKFLCNWFGHTHSKECLRCGHYEVEKYVVDLTKPPISPPTRTFRNNIETEQSKAQVEEWKKYIVKYKDAARKRRNNELLKSSQNLQ